MSDELIKPPSTPDNSLASALFYNGTKTRVKFSGSCLKQDKITFTHGTIVNIYIVCGIHFSDSNSNCPTLENCLFGAVKLTKDAVTNSTNISRKKYKYSGYGIGFDRRGIFSVPSGEFGQNVIIFWSRYEFFCTC